MQVPMVQWPPLFPSLIMIRNLFVFQIFMNVEFIAEFSQLHLHSAHHNHSVCLRFCTLSGHGTEREREGEWIHSNWKHFPSGLNKSISHINNRSINKLSNQLFICTTCRFSSLFSSVCLVQLQLWSEQRVKQNKTKNCSNRNRNWK